MEHFIENGFLDHIGNQILRNLDSKSLVSTCLVSRRYLEFIFTNANKYDNFNAQVTLPVLSEIANCEDDEFYREALSCLPEEQIMKGIYVAACNGSVLI